MRSPTLALLAVLCLGMIGCAGPSASQTQPGAGEAPTGEAAIVGTVTAVSPFQAITENCVDPDADGDPDAPVSSTDAPRCTRPEDRPRGSVRVEKRPDLPAGDNTMDIRVGADTRILRETADGHEAATFGDLREGMRVAVWTIGPVAESYPTQAQGEAIVILDGGE